MFIYEIKDQQSIIANLVACKVQALKNGFSSIVESTQKEIEKFTKIFMLTNQLSSLAACIDRMIRTFQDKDIIAYNVECAKSLTSQIENLAKI